MKKIALNGYFQLVGIMVLNVQNAVKQNITKYLPEESTNALIVITKLRLQQEQYFIKPELP